MAQYSVNLRCYRAKIMRCLSDSGRFVVYMLDYGYADMLSDHQLRSVNPTNECVRVFRQAMPSGEPGACWVH